MNSGHAVNGSSIKSARDWREQAKEPGSAIADGRSLAQRHIQDIALLDVSSNYVARCFDAQLVAGHEDGLGAWKAIGRELKSGGPIELIEYGDSPIRCFELRVDSARTSSEVLSETLALLVVELLLYCCGVRRHN